ncbi:MAG: hypothetical protein WC511_03290 [Candidatus Pacearchaeota archaeon]
MNGNNKKEEKILDLPKIFLYIFEGIILILLLSYIYFSMFGNNQYEGVYSEHIQKELIEALFTSLNLEGIHSIPYLGMNPVIQIYIEENDYFVNSYYLEVIDGAVAINDGLVKDKDIIIWTTEEEILKVMENQTYIKESLVSGRTSIEKASSDFVLFSKGYPDLFINK